MSGPDATGRERVSSLVRRPRILLRLRRLDLLARRAGSPAAWGNRVEAFHDGRPAYEAVLDAVRGARRAIAIEMYTWTDDRIGRRLAEAVRDRARAGISVYVLVDAFGSLGSEDLIRAALKAAAPQG